MQTQNNAAVTGLGGIAQGVTSIRSPQVEEQVKGMEVLADDLRNMVEVLSKRLVSVTRPNLAKDEPMSTPREVLVPLASQLRDILDSVNNSINVLRELGGAIELP